MEQRNSRDKNIIWRLGIVLAGLIPFLGYRLSMAPTINWGDSPELASACHTLGVPHPTGYPLYILIGKIFTLLRFGEPAFMTNLMSVTAAALACMVLYLIIFRILDTVFKPYRFPALTALLGAWLFGGQFLLWEQATQTEVYTLSILLQSLLLLAAVHWLTEKDAAKKDNWFILTVFCLGLSFGCHMTTIIFIPALLWWLVSDHKSIPRRPMVWGLAVLSGLIAASLYMVLVIRAGKYPPLNWGAPTSIKQLIWLISGQQYKLLMSGGLLSSQGIPGIIQTKFWFFDSLTVFCLPAVILSFFFFRKRFRLYTGLLLILAANIILNLNYNIVDISAYYLPTVLIICLLISPVFCSILNSYRHLGLYLIISGIIFGLFGILSLLLFQNRAVYIPPIFMNSVNWIILSATSLLLYAGMRRYFINNWMALPLRCLALVLILTLILGTWWTYKTDRRNNQDWTAWQWSHNVLTTVPEDSLIMTRSDYDIFPLWYQQLCNNLSPDILVVGANFLSSPWYPDLFRNHPINQNGEAFSFETLPGTLIGPDASRKWHNFVYKQLLEPFYGKRPIFTTQDDREFRHGLELELYGNMVVGGEIKQKIFSRPPIQVYKFKDNLTSETLPDFEPGQYRNISENAEAALAWPEGITVPAGGIVDIWLYLSGNISKPKGNGYFLALNVNGNENRSYAIMMINISEPSNVDAGPEDSGSGKYWHWKLAVPRSLNEGEYSIVLINENKDILGQWEGLEIGPALNGPSYPSELQEKEDGT